MGVYQAGAPYAEKYSHDSAGRLDIRDKPDPFVVNGGVCRDVRINNCADVTLRNVVVQQDNPGAITDWTRYNEHGIWIGGGCQKVTLEGVSVFDVWGDFVYFGATDLELTIRDFTGRSSGRQGIAGVACKTLTVDRFELRRVSRFCFDFEPYSSSQHLDTTTVQHGRCFSDGGGTKGFAVVHAGCCGECWWLDNYLDGIKKPEGDIRNRQF